MRHNGSESSAIEIIFVVILPIPSVSRVRRPKSVCSSVPNSEDLVEFDQFHVFDCILIFLSESFTVAI